MKTRTFALLAGLLLTTGAIADELTDTKKAAIRNMMQVSGAADIGKKLATVITQQMIAGLKAARPDVDPRAFTIMEEEIKAVYARDFAPDSAFYQKVYPIYHRYFTLEDIENLTAFYRTPTGEKAVAVMPLLLQDTMKAGRSWAEEELPILQQRLTQRFQEEGIDTE